MDGEENISTLTPAEVNPGCSTSQVDPTGASGEGSGSTISTPSGDAGGDLPVCLVVLGMAGSGKTTFVQRLTAHLHAKKTPPYVLNLDPAVKEVPFPVNIDIRDTVDYKEVMKQYCLGPNGGIVTSLNLFATRFDQVMHLLKKREKDNSYVVMDTPGQIEVFTWSASGTIITDTLASVYPTCIVYVMDIVRSVSPVTFMSNMLYACSILYKTRLPFIIVMNKSDIISPKFALDWMEDFEVFHEALEGEESTGYMTDLTRSLSLVLDEFYQGLKCVGVSAMTGEGFDEFLAKVDQARAEYFDEYKPEYERLKAEKDKAIMDMQSKQLEHLRIDLAKEGKTAVDQSKASTLSEAMRGRKIFLGGMDQPEDEVMQDPDDEDASEKQEYESFKRYLSKQKEAAKTLGEKSS